MTEKSYGGSNGVREHTNKSIKSKPGSNKIKEKIYSKNKKIEKSFINSSLDEQNSYIKAGEIAKIVVSYAKSLIKPNMPLLEIAQKIEAEIIRQGGMSAFPVNLSIDQIAAHYHPVLEDKTLATGLLKIDIGIHVNGFIADTAFSTDLTPDNRYKELINASQDALDSALQIINKDPTFNDIGYTIQKAIEKKGFSPIINLCGHGLGKFEIHQGVVIPNYANNNLNKIEEGAYAIEPFATTGEGKIYEGPGSNIYKIINLKNPRSPTARKLMEYIWNKNQTLPFSMREIQEKFGPMSRLAIKELEQNGIIHHYPQLIEKSHHPVSQAEHTFIKTKDGKMIVTTR